MAGCKLHVQQLCVGLLALPEYLAWPGHLFPGQHFMAALPLSTGLFPMTRGLPQFLKAHPVCILICLAVRLAATAKLQRRGKTQRFLEFDAPSG